MIAPTKGINFNMPAEQPQLRPIKTNQARVVHELTLEVAPTNASVMQERRKAVYARLTKRANQAAFMRKAKAEKKVKQP